MKLAIRWAVSCLLLAACGTALPATKDNQIYNDLIAQGIAMNNGQMVTLPQPTMADNLNEQKQEQVIATVVKLTTDDNVSGIGEVYCDTFGPKAMTAMIEDVFARHVEGMDPFHIEALWRKAYGTGYTLRPDASLMGVLSGIEIALWDIKGKAVGKPVYELLGGKVHDSLRSYTYIYPDLAKGQDEKIYWNAEASAERGVR